MNASIPEDVAQFIRTYIDRLETLEVLVVLQSTRGKAWTARELSDEMRSSALAMEAVMAMLVDRGLVVQEGTAYSFRPRTAELEAVSLRLAACFRERRTAVITQIFSAPNDAVRSFAQAFRIKKDKNDG